MLDVLDREVAGVAQVAPQPGGHPGRGGAAAGPGSPMTTYRLLRQTARSARFARVSVEVTPSGTSSVEVIVDVDEHHRREAELGARCALQDQPARVTVTEVFTTEMDTGTGDV